MSDSATAERPAEEATRAAMPPAPVMPRMRRPSMVTMAAATPEGEELHEDQAPSAPAIGEESHPATVNTGTTDGAITEPVASSSSPDATANTNETARNGEIPGATPSPDASVGHDAAPAHSDLSGPEATPAIAQAEHDGATVPVETPAADVPAAAPAPSGRRSMAAMSEATPESGDPHDESADAVEHAAVHAPEATSAASSAPAAVTPAPEAQAPRGGRAGTLHIMQELHGGGISQEPPADDDPAAPETPAVGPSPSATAAPATPAAPHDAAAPGGTRPAGTPAFDPVPTDSNSLPIRVGSGTTPSGGASGPGPATSSGPSSFFPPGFGPAAHPSAPGSVPGTSAGVNPGTDPAAPAGADPSAEPNAPQDPTDGNQGPQPGIAGPPPFADVTGRPRTPIDENHAKWLSALDAPRAHDMALLKDQYNMLQQSRGEMVRLAEIQAASAGRGGGGRGGLGSLFRRTPNPMGTIQSIDSQIRDLNSRARGLYGAKYDAMMDHGDELYRNYAGLKAMVENFNHKFLSSPQGAAFQRHLDAVATREGQTEAEIRARIHDGSDKSPEIERLRMRANQFYHDPAFHADQKAIEKVAAGLENKRHSLTESMESMHRNGASMDQAQGLENVLDSMALPNSKLAKPGGAKTDALDEGFKEEIVKKLKQVIEDLVNSLKSIFGMGRRSGP